MGQLRMTCSTPLHWCYLKHPTALCRRATLLTHRNALAGNSGGSAAAGPAAGLDPAGHPRAHNPGAGCTSASIKQSQKGSQLIASTAFLPCLLTCVLRPFLVQGPLWLPSRKQHGGGRSPAGAQQAAPTAALLQQHDGPCRLSTLLDLLCHQWQQLGLGPRTLCDSELAVLARRAGFNGGLQAGQPPLSAAALRRFAAWLAPQLAVLRAVGPGIYACQAAQLVCGFDVDRSEAEAALAPHGPGTFCLRLSSIPGHLVVSLREPADAHHCRRSTDACSGGSGSYGPSSSSSQDDRPAVSHYLFTADRLHLTGLNRALAEVPGCLRLLDVRTGRTHRPTILRKAAAAAPNAATARPIAL